MLPAMLLPDIGTGPELPETLSEPVIFPFTKEVVPALLLCFGQANPVHFAQRWPGRASRLAA